MDPTASSTRPESSSPDADSSFPSTESSSASPDSSSADAGLRIDRLRIHPVKGARGTDVDAMEFDEIGPCFDRRWMVVRPGGLFVTQRELPALATVRPRLADGALTLEAPGAEPVSVPLDFDGPSLRVRVWEAQVTAATGPPVVDHWLSQALAGDYRLVFLGRDAKRLTDPAYAEGHRVGFADGYPALVVGSGSVDELSRRAGRAIPVERFRPNVVVAGARPHEEDRWHRFAAGEMTFSGVKLCARCVVTTQDQRSGARDPDGEPLRTLAKYRRIEDKAYFGLNAVHHGPGRLRVGDEVEALERGPVPGAWR